MRDLFVITGPPGSGKTPLLRELMARGYIGVPEPAREVLAEQRAIDGPGVPDKSPALFNELMLVRAIDDFRRMESGDAPVFFDRGIPDLVGYAELFGLETKAAQRAAEAHRYGDVVFVLPSWPEIYTTDDERKMTFEMTVAFGTRVRDVYLGLGYTLVDVPKASPSARAAFVLERIGL